MLSDTPPLNADPAARDRRATMAATKPFRAPDLKRSAWQLGTTFLAYLGTVAVMYLSLNVSAWLTLALAFPAAGLLVRVFIIQHDCGHGSFFPARRLNDLIGRVCGVITFTPYAFWHRQHANHHACFNNLERRESGADVYSTCATLREYSAFQPMRRLLYRVSRHPLVSQFLLPPVVFMLVYRVPFDTPASWTRERASVYLNNPAFI